MSGNETAMLEKHRNGADSLRRYLSLAGRPPRMALECWDALASALSRLEAAEARISQMEGDLAGRALMDAEGEAFLPEVVEQLQARIEELEETDTGKLRAEVNGTIRVQMSYIAKLEARIEALETFVAVARGFHGAGNICEQNRARRRTICEICDGLAALATKEKP